MKISFGIKDVVRSSDVQVRSHLYKQALGTIASSLISMCSGLTLGITAVMLPQLRQDKNIHYEASHESWIASIAPISMIIGSLSCGSILDSYGRRATHIILGGPFIIGWAIIACANSTIIILIGRFITGLSSGANKSVTMVYIGEIADPRVRAAALFLPGVMTNTGILFSHVVGYYFTWKTSAIICLIPAVISSISFLFLKESPLWLIVKGRTEEGIDTFRWFRGMGDASEAELKTVLESQSEKPNMTIRETLNIVCTKAFIKPMLILIIVMVNVQFSGVTVLNFYAEDIFENAFSSNVDPFILMTVMDFIRSIASVIICVIGKFIPKKLSFVISSFGVTLCCFGLVTCFMINYASFIWVPVLCLILYICFSSAIVTIGWTFVPEVLPNNARGLGSGIISSLSYMLLFSICKTLPGFVKLYSETALFAFFGISTLICGVIICFVLPETNGKTLQSIEDSFTVKIKQEQSVL